MQAWGTVVVTLVLIVATVDAKIYERCDLVMKLEKAGLNGFQGYGIGDCETSVAPCLTYTPNLPPCLDTDPPCNLPRPGHNLLSHPLTDCDEWFNQF